VAISISDITTGTGINLNGDLFIVLETKHVKPGKGGAFLRTKLRNVRTKQGLDRTFRPGDKIEEVHLEEKKLQNLYQSGSVYHFMDMTSFEELTVPADIIGDQVKFLQDNIEVVALCLRNEVLSITLPTFIQSDVTHTEPGFKGDTATGGSKPATIDTGASVQVPLFINIGEKIKIDTRTGTYVERVKR
jgi:elongation factor P